jgi:hypothetical protein
MNKPAATITTTDQLSSRTNRVTRTRDLTVIPAHSDEDRVVAARLCNTHPGLSWSAALHAATSHGHIAARILAPFTAR